MQRHKRFATLPALLLCIFFITAANTFVTAQHSREGFKKIFDGKTLKGWKGDTAYWRVENNSIVGEVTAEKPLKTNTFLIYDGGKPGDFELEAEGGARFWLYRRGDGDDPATGDLSWHMHGVFA